MNYRSSKFKGQSSRQAPGDNLQETGVSNGSKTWWYDLENNGTLLLKDEPQSGGERHPWDLLERTAIFGERIVRFSKKIPRDPTNNRLIDQIIGAGTSVGANYCEANEAVSKKDFKNIISHCVKEAKETKFFLRMVVASEPPLADEARSLYREAHELLCIFASMRKR